MSEKSDFIIPNASPISKFLSRLEGVKQKGKGFVALCPSHEDNEPSLSLKEVNNGKILINCFVGCPIESIVSKLNLQMSDLFSPSQETFSSSYKAKKAFSSTLFTLEALAQDKKIPLSFLKELGLFQKTKGVVGIPYKLEDGSLAQRQRLRKALKAKEGSFWEKGEGETVLYGLWKLGEARTLKKLVFIEGESDSWTLWFHDFPCLGFPGADMAKKLESRYLEEISSIYIVREPDRGGTVFVQGIATRLQELDYQGEAFVVQLPEGTKDPNELYQKNPETFKSSFQEALEQAISLEQILIESEEKKPKTESSLSKEFVLQCYLDDEVGDARLFATCCKNRFVYDHASKTWYEFDQYWKEDEVKLVQEAMRIAISQQYLELSFTVDREATDIETNPENLAEDAKQKLTALKKSRDGLRKRCKDLNKVNRLRNILAIAVGGQFLGISGKQWDKEKWVLGTMNGIIDLKTGEFRSQQPKDYIRKVAPVEWKGLQEPCPRWELFQQEIVGEDDSSTKEMTEFKHRLLGQAIIGDKLEHIFPIIYGAEGRNGKETEFETLKQVLGDLAKPIDKDVVIAAKKPSLGTPKPEIYDLWGVRIAWLSETAESEQINVARVKHLTGGGTIKCRPLHGNMVEFEPSHTLFIFTNHKPHAPAEDSALWERILLIEYPRKFVDKPTESCHRKKDPRLKTKLKAEASGILAWLVRGCLNWQEEGLNIPEKIKSATQEYRESQDVLNDFIDECCIVMDSSNKYQTETKAGDIYIAYKNWSMENGRKALGSRNFGERLSRKFERQRKKEGLIYYGILLRSSKKPYI